MLLQFFINGLITGILYSLSAIGFALVYNTTRIFHIAAAALYVVAAYIFFFSFRSLDLPLFLSAIISLMFTALLSVLCEWLVYRPLKNKKSSLNVVMISSIGVMAILINIVALLFGNETKVLDHRIQRIFTFNDIIITTPQMWQLILGTLAIIAFMFFLRVSSFGIKARALSSDNTLFPSNGIQYYRHSDACICFKWSFFSLKQLFDGVRYWYGSAYWYANAD